MKKCIYFLITIILLMSCAQAKDIAYFQGLDKANNIIDKDSFSIMIKPRDILSISVVSSEPDASSRYNLVTPQVMSPGEPTNYIYSQPMLQNYLVDDEGNINFPSLGKLHVSGLTKSELTNLLENKLKPFFLAEMPIITIRIMNFSINVLGEVRNPGRFQTNSERITIFEGLAMAGDISIYGKRGNVKVLRENDSGDRNVYMVNLNDKSIFDSPVYYLEQNDVVYVEPNKSRTNSSMYGEAENYRISTLSVVISLATMATTIFGLTRR